MSNGYVGEILIVEDNPEDLELTLRALHRASLRNRLEVARDGAEALEFVFCEGAHRGRSIEDAPKVILLDLKLPRVDGLEVLRRIRSDPRTSAIPVVVITSSQQQRDLVESCRLGANSYVMKPVTFEQFARALQWLGIGGLLADEVPAATK
jgi:CheY-like chemotaxis protein